MAPLKLPLTHFLCLPLVTEISKPQLQSSLRKFTSEILGARNNEDTANIIPEKAIRPIGTLHLTLGVMSLTSPERVDGAWKLLEEIDLLRILREAGAQNPQLTSAQADGGANGSQKQVAGSGPVSPLMVTLSSLTSMHSPSSTSILYASPTDTSNRVLPFCLDLREKFMQAGFLLPDNRPLLLHVTIMNTIYATDRRSRGKTHGGKRWDRGGSSQNATGERGHGLKKGKLTIDATDIIQNYENYEWATDVKIEKVAICKMGAKKSVDQDGNMVEEYEEVTSKPLP